MRRLKRKYRRILWILVGIVTIIVSLRVITKKVDFRLPSVHKITGVFKRHTKPKDKKSTYYPSIRDLGKQFNDLNTAHLNEALEKGLKEVPKTRADVNKKNLDKVVDCRYYIVDRLDYSIPYLTHGGKKLLNEIGINFRDSLISKKITPARLVVTSVLRTSEDVTRLRASGNVNASANSAHCYGTTFDISWASWDMPSNANATWDQYRGVLAEVLYDLRKQGDCYVKFEAKQSCFHITSRLK